MLFYISRVSTVSPKLFQVSAFVFVVAFIKSIKNLFYYPVKIFFQNIFVYRVTILCSFNLRFKCSPYTFTLSKVHEFDLYALYIYMYMSICVYIYIYIIDLKFKNLKSTKLIFYSNITAIFIYSVVARVNQVKKGLYPPSLKPKRLNSVIPKRMNLSLFSF